MHKSINGLILLCIVITFSSLFVVFRTQQKQAELEQTIATQAAEISDLRSQLEMEPTETEMNGAVQGAQTTGTGIISGIVTVSQTTQNSENEAIIVCAEAQYSDQEYCTDILLESFSNNSMSYELDIPEGDYFISAQLLPETTKVYFSEVQNCDDQGNCKSATKPQRKIKLLSDSTETGIDLFL